jgi:two-component system, NarL family, sensor histidine kinase DesK
LCLLLGARMFSVLYYGVPGQLPFTVALFVLPLLYAFPRTRRVLARHRVPVLAVQAAATWVPFAVFGGSWQVGIGGLLAGLVLLMVPGPASWPLAGGLLAAEVAVRSAVTGLPLASHWFSVVYVVTYYVDDALVFFGMVRLAQIVGEVQDARSRAADLAVTDERLLAARSLHSAVGQRLADISAMAAAARRALSRDAAQARARIAEAGITAREAVARAREVAAGDRSLPRAEPAASPFAGAVIGARLAWVVLVVVLSMFTVENIAYCVYAHYSTRLLALAAGDIVLTGALQLYHSGAARNGRKPRAWPVTLGLQAVLVYAFLLPFVWAYVGGLGGFLAGCGSASSAEPSRQGRSRRRCPYRDGVWSGWLATVSASAFTSRRSQCLRHQCVVGSSPGRACVLHQAAPGPADAAPGYQSCWRGLAEVIT